MIVESVTNKSPATLAAFCKADRSTFAGVMTPCFIRSPYLRVSALKPSLPFICATLVTTTVPRSPAFSAIVRSGTTSASATVSTPKTSSPVHSARTFFSPGIARMNESPPPGTTPSATAARVACNASSTRLFFSFNSVSLLAPTLICAIPPASFAKRSCSFSRSYSESVRSISVRI